MSETTLVGVLCLVLGAMVGFQYARWIYKGDVDVLLWNVKRKK